MKKLLYIFILLLGLTACKTQYIEVPKVHTEYIVKNLMQHDTLRITDSVLIREKGDTVFVDRVRHRDRVSVVNRTNTVIKTDTVSFPVQVEKKLSIKQKTYMTIGRYSAKIIGIAIILIVVLRALRKTKIIRLIKTFL